MRRGLVLALGLVACTGREAERGGEAAPPPATAASTTAAVAATTAPELIAALAATGASPPAGPLEITGVLLRTEPTATGAALILDAGDGRTVALYLAGRVPERAAGVTVRARCAAVRRVSAGAVATRCATL